MEMNTVGSVMVNFLMLLKKNLLDAGLVKRFS
jgi:hypothetical protein